MANIEYLVQSKSQYGQLVKLSIATPCTQSYNKVDTFTQQDLEDELIAYVTTKQFYAKSKSDEIR